MEFMGIGPMELLLILLIALIVFGPKRLPEISMQMGKFMRFIRQASLDITKELNQELQSTKQDVADATEEIRETAKTTFSLEEEEKELKPQPEVVGPDNRNEKTDSNSLPPLPG